MYHYFGQKRELKFALKERTFLYAWFVAAGFDVYDDCGISSRATDGVSELVPLTDTSVLMKCEQQCNASNSEFLGVYKYSSRIKFIC